MGELRQLNEQNKLELWAERNDLKIVVTVQMVRITTAILNGADLATVEAVLSMLKLC